MLIATGLQFSAIRTVVRTERVWSVDDRTTVLVGLVRRDQVVLRVERHVAGRLDEAGDRELEDLLAAPPRHRREGAHVRGPQDPHA